MNGLDTLRDAIVATLHAAFPVLPSVEGHGGRFDLPELQRMGAQTPALRVVVLQVPEAMDSAAGSFDLAAEIAVFVVTRDAPQKPKDAAALATVSQLLTVIPGNRWGLDFIDHPETVRADNLYSAPLDKVGIALWAISWRQIVRLERDGVEAALVDLKTFVTDYYLPPVTDPPGTPAATDETQGMDQ